MTGRKRRGRRTGRRGRGNAGGGGNLDITYVDMAPALAAPRLGFPSVGALWAFMRSHESEDGRVELGGGVYSYKRGRRRIVRFPLSQ